MKAMIFAAGLGTRLRPLTDTMPKAMVPVGGRPLLRHVMDRLMSYGYDDITVNVHHFAEQIVEYISAHEGIAAAPGKGIHISDETDLLRETGGGIAHARNFLDGGEPFLIHNVDILSNLDLAAVRQAHRADALATLVVSERETSRYLLFDDDMRLVGWTNVKTGEIKSPFAEVAAIGGVGLRSGQGAACGIDLSKCRKLAFSGIHMMSPEVFALMEGLPEKFPIIDFYLSVAAEKPIYGYIPEGLRMLDVGKVDSLAEAESFLNI